MHFGKVIWYSCAVIETVNVFTAGQLFYILQYTIPKKTQTFVRPVINALVPESVFAKIQHVG